MNYYLFVTLITPKRFGRWYGMAVLNHALGKTPSSGKCSTASNLEYKCKFNHALAPYQKRRLGAVNHVVAELDALCSTASNLESVQRGTSPRTACSSPEAATGCGLWRFPECFKLLQDFLFMAAHPLGFWFLSQCSFLVLYHFAQAPVF